MKAAIGGGYIEVVLLANGMLLLVDEDGLRKRLPLNPLATAFMQSAIVGDALLCRRDEID